MYRYRYIVYFMILVSINISYGYSSSNRLIIKYYNNINCTGDVSIISTLLLSDSYCINFPIPKHIQVFESGVRLSHCGCQSNDTSCSYTLSVNQCYNGTKLIYGELDYKESEYCVVTQTDYSNKEIFDYRFKGFVAIKNDYYSVHSNKVVECDFEKMVVCDILDGFKNGCVEIHNRFRILYKDYSNSLMLIDDMNFYIKPIFQGADDHYWFEVFKDRL